MIQHTSNFPRFGFCFPARIFKAVDFPIPFVPTNPKTSPGLGVGNLELRCTIMTYSVTVHVHVQEKDVYVKKTYSMFTCHICCCSCCR